MHTRRESPAQSKIHHREAVTGEVAAQLIPNQARRYEMGESMNSSEHEISLKQVVSQFVTNDNSTIMNLPNELFVTNFNRNFTGVSATANGVISQQLKQRSVQLVGYPLPFAPKPISLTRSGATTAFTARNR